MTSHTQDVCALPQNSRVGRDVPGNMFGPGCESPSEASEGEGSQRFRFPIDQQGPHRPNHVKETQSS